MGFIDDLFSAKRYIHIVLIGSFLLVGIPYVIIVNWPYWLNKISPYSDLNNKVAVDGLHLSMYGYSRDKNEIYLIDTLKNSYRQLTSDEHFNEDPVISLDENKVYFVSNKPHDLGSIAAYDFLYAYNLTTNEIEEVDPNEYERFQDVM